MELQTPNNVVSYFVNSFKPAIVNYPQQVKLAKKLLEKYSYQEIIFALNYYQSIGNNIYSLGFLTYKNNMKNPKSLYKAEQNKLNKSESGERNRQRIKQILETEHREDYPCYLFTEQ